jgi:hypothetical protein
MMIIPLPVPKAVHFNRTMPKKLETAETIQATHNNKKG